MEPTKPQMCHDERYLNLWMRHPALHLDPITDLPRYVGKNHFQSKLDKKSGYDHIKLTKASWKFFGLEWQGWYFVFTTLPFGWSPSTYIYHITGLGASNIIRSKGVPISQYIDDRHVGQARHKGNPKNDSSDIDQARAGIFITALVLIQCGYFINLSKSVFEPINFSFFNFVKSIFHFNF